MSDSTPTRGERALIRRLKQDLGAALANQTVPFGDDMAPLPGGGGLLWTVDVLTAGIDFDPAVHSWYEIGRKALAVNLSDCAAMAVVPLAALCGVVLDERMSMDDAMALLRGVRDCGEQFGCPLVGGDTNSWPQPTAISVTVAARPDGGLPPVLRTGGRPGDRVFVTGKLGGSILGRHITFTPRVALARAINAALRPHAMIDISDGLAADLGQIAEASGCGAVLDVALLAAAIHADAVELARRDGTPAVDHGLFDGEDFELIVAVDAGVPEGACENLGLLPLGELTAATGLRLRTTDGVERPLTPGGWEHFQ